MPRLQLVGVTAALSPCGMPVCTVFLIRLHIPTQRSPGRHSLSHRTSRTGISLPCAPSQSGRFQSAALSERIAAHANRLRWTRNGPQRICPEAINGRRSADARRTLSSPPPQRNRRSVSLNLSPRRGRPAKSRPTILPSPPEARPSAARDGKLNQINHVESHPDPVQLETRG